MRFAVDSAQAVRDYQRGQENYGNCASPLSSDGGGRRIAAKQYSYSLVASFRQECRREGYGERRSEIIARYQPWSEESFISDFWAAEARKSDTRPLSRNFGRLIITSRRGARERGRDVRRRQQ